MCTSLQEEEEEEQQQGWAYMPHPRHSCASPTSRPSLPTAGRVPRTHLTHQLRSRPPGRPDPPTVDRRPAQKVPLACPKSKGSDIGLILRLLTSFNHGCCTKDRFQVGGRQRRGSRLPRQWPIKAKISCYEL